MKADESDFIKNGGTMMQVRGLSVLAALGMAGALAFAGMAAPVELTWAIPGNAQEQEVYRTVARQFEREHPGITVITDNTAANREKLAVMIAAGSPPDIPFVTIEHSAAFIEAGAFLPLDPLIRRDNFDLDDFFPQILAPYRWDGTRHGAGPLYGLPKEVAIRATYYNRSMFQTAGLEPPPAYVQRNAWNWESWLEVAKKLTRDADGDGAPEQWGITRETWLGMWMMWVWANGGDIVDDPFRPRRFTLDSPQAVEALQYYADLSAVHKVAPPNGGGSEPFAAQEAALYQNGRWMVPRFRSVPELDFDVVQAPTGKRRAQLLTGSAFAIAAGTEHPEEAWSLLKFISGDAGQRAMVEMGLLLPPRKSLGPLFLSNTPPESNQVFLDELNYARPLPITPVYKAIADDTLAKYFGPMMRGEVLARTVVETVKPIVNEILSEAAR
ncbi:MAG TPA: sugar ABC transporter substrate-binding protein [Limnochordia bacterium]